MLDQVQVAVIVSELDGRIVDCNRHAEQLFGMPREEILGEVGLQYSAEPMERGLARAIANQLRTHQTWEGDFRLRRRDGSVVVVHAVDSGVFDDDGKLSGVVSIASDVTDRWRALRRLTAQEQLARLLVTATDLGAVSDRVLEITRDRLEWSFGALWEVEGDRLRCVGVSAGERVDPGFADETARTLLRRGQGLPGLVWEAREPSDIVEVATGPLGARTARARRTGLSRAVAVPLVGGDDVFGVLELMASGTEPADADLVPSLSTLGIQLGQFVARRRAEEAARVTEARKAAMLEAALDAVVSMDHDGRIVEWNEAARITFGWSRDEVVGRTVQDVIVPSSLQQGHRTGLAKHLSDGRRTLLDRRVETIARRRDGSEFPVELTVTRVDGLDGPLFIAFLRDISERVKAEAERVELERREQSARTRLDLMAQLGDILTVDLDAAARLQAITAVLLPVFSDVCAVITRDAQGDVRFAALAHADDSKQSLIDSVGEWSALGRIFEASTDVAVAAQPRIIAPVTDAMLQLAFPDANERSVVRALQLKAVLVVPLPGDEGPMGALAFATSDPDRRYGDDDVALAEDIARRFAPVVESALRFEQERSVAETLQRSLLPERLPAMRELELAARYLPGTAGLSIGGDWYDVLPLPDGRVLLAIGDVVGHGVRAAAVMGRARAATQFCALTEVGPGELLTRLNTFFAAADDGSMLTLFVALHEPLTGRLHYASAGHPPPVVRGADGAIRFLDQIRGAPLGAEVGHGYGERVDELGPGASLVLYTDGLIERRGESLDVGFSRLGGAVQTGPDDLDALVEHLLGTMLPGEGATDDVALLVVRSVGAADRLDLVLPVEPRQLRILRSRLAGWLGLHGVDPETIFEVSLAVSEAAANAVSHAYGLEDAEFEVQVCWEDDVLVCTVSDHGRWRERPRDGNGRGLMLMRSLADRVDIDASSVGTRVSLRRRVGSRNT